MIVKETTGKFYYHLTMIDKDGNEKLIELDPYLYGVIISSLVKKKNKWHNMILITGAVGDGKSTLVETLSAILEAKQGRQLTFDNVCWRTEKLIELTDNPDNVGHTLWWDESIQGAGSKQMALTSIGEKLKIAMVTKRFKKHTYIFVVDEINEFSHKLIRMCDAWIHVHTRGLERGFFKIWVNKRKILSLYDAFKNQKLTWKSKYVNMIRHDWAGRFKDYHGVFLDEHEYDKKKLEETKQSDENQRDAKSDRINKLLAHMIYVQRMRIKDIAAILGITPNGVSNIKARFSQKDIDEAKKRIAPLE